MQVTKRWLPMDEVLQARGITMTSKCQCFHAYESINHVIVFNKEICNVWEWFSTIFNVQVINHNSVLERFKSWVSSSDDIGKNHIRILIPILIDWFAWTSRNDIKHNGDKISAIAIIFKIMNLIHLIHSAKPFSKAFWKGDLVVVGSWDYHLLSLKK